MSWVVDGQVQYLPEPFEIIDRPLWWHLKGLSQTRLGYGSKIATPRCVQLPDGRIRRIYVTIWSNSGTCWVVIDGKQLVVS